MLVVGSQHTKLHTGHQHKALVTARECGVGAALELPLVVFNPAILVLKLVGIVACAGIGSQVGIVLLVKQTEGRSERYCE